MTIMKSVREDLTALIFELQRARSPVDRARALARAWRTIRSLSSAERSLLAREVGFEGAEDLVEGLAGKAGGVFAPAAVLEALGRMRRDENLSVREVLKDLRDPDRREDLLVRGIDLATEALADEPDEEPPQEVVETSPGIDSDLISVAVEDRREILPLEPPVQESDDREDESLQAPDAIDEVELPAIPPVEQPEPERESVPESQPGAELEGDHDSVIELVPGNDTPSVWEDLWQRPEEGLTAAPSTAFGPPPASLDIESAAEGSILDRLRAIRVAAAELRGAPRREIEDRLDTLSEPWARRRALAALIEQDIPDDPAEALDLIEALDRPMDRRWCLSALARRGDLAGGHLERALAMLASPAARRRVAALATAKSRAAVGAER